jgi:hypothetical protein
LSFGGLQDAQVQLLGGRGRALGEDRLFTGALTEWSDHDLEHSVVQLLHERAVRGAGEVD